MTWDNWEIYNEKTALLRNKVAGITMTKNEKSMYQNTFAGVYWFTHHHLNLIVEITTRIVGIIHQQLLCVILNWWVFIITWNSYTCSTFPIARRCKKKKNVRYLTGSQPYAMAMRHNTFKAFQSGWTRESRFQALYSHNDF